MTYLAKYQKAEDYYNALVAEQHMSADQAKKYMLENVKLYQVVPNVDSSQDKRLMNTQNENLQWFQSVALYSQVKKANESTLAYVIALG